MKRLALAFIRFYQTRISRHLPPTCRFVPSCSEYAYQAVDRLAVASGRIDNILKLYKAGLIDEAAAREKAWDLL